MISQLLIRLKPDGSLVWIAKDQDSAAAVEPRTGMPDADLLAAAPRIIVLVSNASVLSLSTPAITTQRAKLAKAIPYALEDQLASPVEELHFALSEQVTDSEIGVAVVARNQVQAWLAQLASYGIRPDILLPEGMAMPLKADTVTVLIEEDSLSLRIAGWSVLTATVDNLPQVLSIIDSGQALPRALEVFDFRMAPALALQGPSITYHAQQRDALTWLGQNIGAGPSVNLLQGEFAPSHRQAPVQKLWRLAAMLAAVTIVLSLLYIGIERWQLQREMDRLIDAEQQVLHESFPNLTRADDPPRLMESELKRLRGGSISSGGLHLLAQIAPVLGSTTRITTKGMEYRNATLEIALRAPDVPSLDAIRERLATLPGLKVEVTAANPSEGAVDGRLRINGVKP